MDMAWLAENRAIAMAGLFVLFVIWESRIPVTTQTGPIGRRWMTNYTLYLISSGVSIALHALPALWGAHWADLNDIGLFNLIIVPVWLQCLLAIIALDLKQYVTHRFMHRFDCLWRFHRLHHSDRDVDITTGFRFHPVEASISVSLHILVVVALGLSPGIVLFYWLVLVAANYFTHANVRVPEKADRLLQRLIITPSLHRLHHSRAREDQGYNFGSLLTLWDRLAKTYRPGGSVEEQSQRTFGIAL